jgi:hypothetical protein
MWYLYMMEYYSAMKNEILSFSSKWIELDNIQGLPGSEDQKPFVLPHMCILDPGQMQ